MALTGPNRSVCAGFQRCDDRVLVDVVVDVGSVDEYADCASDSDGQEYVELQTIDYHGNVPPVFEHLHTITLRFIVVSTQVELEPLRIFEKLYDLNDSE